MHKAIEKLIEKRTKFIEEHNAFQDAEGMLKIADMYEYKKLAKQIHCINYGIHLLGEK